MYEGIDIVIPWVDGKDLRWQEDKARYSSEKIDVSNSINRYRDWDNLQFIFRGIEKNMNWIRKIHFITYGHLPSWLNISHPKLNIVKHEDYIPKEYLPTFSSHVIELNLHRINGLSEKFIYFNDDIFILDSLNENDFFTNNLPNDFLVEYPITNGIVSELFPHVLLNNNAIINKYFNKRKQVKYNLNKHFSFKYGKLIINNLTLLPYKNYCGFLNPHTCQSFLKSTFQELWSIEEQFLSSVCLNKFRTNIDVNQYLFRDWQLASGNFYPKSFNKLGKSEVLKADLSAIVAIIKKQKYKILCLNDNDLNLDYEMVKSEVNSALEYLYREKCSYELNL